MKFEQDEKANLMPFEIILFTIWLFIFMVFVNIDRYVLHRSGWMTYVEDFILSIATLFAIILFFIAVEEIRVRRRKERDEEDECGR